VVTPNTEPVLDLADVKDHLHILAADTSHDSWLTDRIKAVKEVAEDIMSRTLMNTTYDLKQDGFGGQDNILIPFPPLSSVTGVYTTDRDDTETEFASSNYFVDSSRPPGRVILKDDSIWPVNLRSNQSVRVRFVGGYGADNTSVPEKYKQIMYDIIGFWFCRRTGAQGDFNWDKSKAALESYRIESL
jgi:uncharacterized phiE125 gp8 family phage protein